jgi:hypothetical protein
MELSDSDFDVILCTLRYHNLYVFSSSPITHLTATRKGDQYWPATLISEVKRKKFTERVSQSVPTGPCSDYTEFSDLLMAM